MKVEINQTIDPKKVTVYSHRTGKYIDTIPTEGGDVYEAFRGGRV